MKKKLFVLAPLTAILVASMFFAMIPNAKALALVVPGVTTNPVPPGYGFTGFEEGTDGAIILSTIPGLHFTTTAGQNWVYADARTGAYNVRSLTDPSVNHGDYVCNGYFVGWLGPNQGQGIINFTGGTASYFSLLVSCNTVFYVDAYDSSGNLIDTSGPVAGNWPTHTFTRVTIQHAGMASVICHDTGNYWVIDDIVTDAPGVPLPTPSSPRELKNDAISELNAAKLLTSETWLLKEIDSAVYCIQKSLTSSFWVDDSHLNLQSGYSVFEWEVGALMQLLPILTSKAKVDVKNIVQAVINKLMKADEILASTAIKEAKALGSTNPTIIYYIRRADDYFSMAQKAFLTAFTPKLFEQAWAYAEKALF